MSIKFGGKTIKGTHGLATKGPQMLLRHTADLWSLLGRLEIIGGRTARRVHVDILLHASYAKASKLESDLRVIESLLGISGTMEVTATSGTTAESFTNATFIEFERLSFEGRGDTGPVYDHAGTVDGGWCQLARLHFEQLTVPTS